MTQKSNKEPQNWSDAELKKWAEGTLEAGVGDDKMAEFVATKLELKGDDHPDEVKRKYLASLDDQKAQQSKQGAKTSEATKADQGAKDDDLQGPAKDEDKPDASQITEAQPETETRARNKGELSPQPETDQVEHRDQTMETAAASEHNEITDGRDPKQQSTNNPRAATITRTRADDSVDRGEDTMASRGDNPTQTVALANLDEYKQEMMPGKAHSTDEGAALQTKLYRTILSILRMKGSNFTRMWSELLDFVHQNRDTLFNEKYVHRYFQNLSMQNGERKNFERILNLLIATSDPATRSRASEQVDIDATMEGFNDPDMHQRVSEYYSGDSI